MGKDKENPIIVERQLTFTVDLQNKRRANNHESFETVKTKDNVDIVINYKNANIDIYSIDLNSKPNSNWILKIGCQRFNATEFKTLLEVIEKPNALNFEKFIMRKQKVGGSKVKFKADAGDYYISIGNRAYPKTDYEIIKKEITPRIRSKYLIDDNPNSLYLYVDHHSIPVTPLLKEQLNIISKAMELAQTIKSTNYKDLYKTFYPDDKHD